MFFLKIFLARICSWNSNLKIKYAFISSYVLLYKITRNENNLGTLVFTKHIYQRKYNFFRVET